MEKQHSRKLAVILHADVVGSTALVRRDETLAHERIQSAFRRLAEAVSAYGGTVHETRGDALVAEFTRPSDAVCAALRFQRANTEHNASLGEGIVPEIRVGIALGEEVFADNTVTGSGVVLAQRLEQLASAGGVVVQASVAETVPARLPFEFESLGDQVLKGFEQPVRAFAAHLKAGEQIPEAESAVASAERDGNGDHKRTGLQLPDKPSIVVLPFTNMSGSPEQDVFADGVTEDIITGLSRFSGLFVIARNSAFTYKGRVAKAQDVRHDLGVRYIVEGSVRRAGDRVRVTVQLIDSESGRHLWAERYDRELADIFELQDELTQAIVATLPGQLLLAEETRVRRKAPQQMAAYDYLIAGRIHHHRVTPEDNSQAQRLLDVAIRLDPHFAEAYAWKACTIGQALQFGFLDDPANAEEEAFALLDRALALNENDVECHRLLCEVSMEGRRFEQAEKHNERALAMNPNDPRIVAQRGELLTWLGQAEEGAEWIEKALRLDPFAAPRRAHLLGRALYGARRYADALDAYKMTVSPSYPNLAEAAACCARLDDHAGAAELVTEVLRLNPRFTIAQHMRMRTYRDAADAAHLAEGLRAAGLPE